MGLYKIYSLNKLPKTYYECYLNFKNNNYKFNNNNNKNKYTNYFLTKHSEDFFF